MMQTSLAPRLQRNFHVKIHVSQQRLLKPGIWLTGTTAASQSEALFTNMEIDMGQVTEVRLSCYLVLLPTHRKTR